MHRKKQLPCFHRKIGVRSIMIIQRTFAGRPKKSGVHQVWFPNLKHSGVTGGATATAAAKLYYIVKDFSKCVHVSNYIVNLN
jgi:hypothetical protein